MKKICLQRALLALLISVPSLTRGQDSLATTTPFRPVHTAFAGVQIPLNYTLGYRYQFSRRLSAQVQGD